VLKIINLTDLIIFNDYVFKTIENQNLQEAVMKKNVFLISIFIVLLLSSCIYFQTINQPTVSLPNEIITVSIIVTTEGGEYEPYFGVCLPIGWTIPGDSLQCSGVYNEVIFYDTLVANEQENVSPAPVGYYWWAGKGVVDTSATGEIYADLLIQTDNQTGIFSIDYMLGNSYTYNGVNHQRSNNHQIEIVDEYTPSGLQASVVGEYVFLIWDEPLNTSGLLGYNIYRDEQQINPLLLTSTTFIDENPLEGIHYYSVSSFYSDGSEYLIPYEVRVIYGNSLYVSPNGSDSSSGASFGEPLLTINYAISVLTPDSLNHKTIFLSEGVFSPSTTGEVFPLEWKNYISLKGISEETTILDGENQSIIVQFDCISDAKFENIKIRNGQGNESEGGGILCDNSSPELVNVTITNNSAVDGGGGIQCSNNSHPRLINVTIADNYAGIHGGGIHCIQNSNPILTNVLITNNNSGSWGGGIRCLGSSPILENVTITNNSAVDGGGINLSGGSPQLLNVTITNNSAVDGGGMFCRNASPLLLNVTITNNSAVNGGGMFCRNASPLLLNVTMTNNYAEIGGGGLFLNRNSNTILKNCILWSDSIAEIYFSNEFPNAPSTITVYYSNVQGGHSGIITNGNATVNWLEGNIDEDPLFVGTGDYPYLLSSGSPCIDAGHPDTTYNDPEDPNNLGYALWPAMGTIRNDMGAYGGPNAAFWNGVIPVELISFAASISEGRVYLNWTTATETNNSGFEIDRKTNNSDWTIIGFKKGAGTTTEPQNYSFIDDIADIKSTSISYRLKQIDFNGSYEYSDEVLVDNTAPSYYALQQNYPNPFNPSTTIQYAIKERSTVEVVLYDILGEEVEVLVNEEQDAGYYKINFNAGRLASGIYFYRLQAVPIGRQAGSFVETKKMILLK